MLRILSFTILSSALVSTLFADDRPVNSPLLLNQAAFIPSQCYVKTEVAGKTFNTCYTCHTDSKAPNFMNDADTQLEYGFNKYARRNRWSNLFVDRSEQVAAMKDADIQQYVRTSNYLKDGELILAKTLSNLPESWDSNDNKVWDGYQPDSYFNFDEEGFDRDPKGGYTGWRSFVYVPFPGGFIPAAGSADDVLIRLPNIYRQTDKEKFDLETYKLNLSIVESLIKQEDVHIPVVDETKWGVDLDRNGKLEKASLIKFKSNAVDGSGMDYVGRAGLLQKNGAVQLAAGLYPKGTEFLHSVRYLDTKNGSVVMAPRMKELRYTKKVGWASVVFHDQFALAEAQERELFPEQIPAVTGDHEKGVLNGLGWRFQGFIEGKDGALRPQNYEEHVFCVGCHSAIGALHDSTFSFGRKHNGYEQGWTSWNKYSPAIIFADEVVQDKFQDYLSTAGGPTDFSDKTIYKNYTVENLLPKENAVWEMNKAYKVIVEEQSFVKGRDATIKNMKSEIHRVISPEQKTGVINEKVSPF